MSQVIANPQQLAAAFRLRLRLWGWGGLLMALVNFILVLPTAAESLSFEELKGFFEKKLSELEAKKIGADAEAKKVYRTKVEELLKKFSDRADLERALIVQKELELLDSNQPLQTEKEIQSVADLLSIHQRYLEAKNKQDLDFKRAIRKDARKYVRLLEKKVIELTRARELKKAVDAKAEIERIENRFLAEDEPDPKNLGKDFENRLRNTKWDHHQSNYPTRPVETFILGNRGQIWMGGRIGEWKVEDARKREISIKMDHWAFSAVLRFDAKLSQYKGEYLGDKAPRHGAKLEENVKFPRKR